MRYFKVKDENGWVSIWETNNKKTKERIIFSSDKDSVDLERMRKVWTEYDPPGMKEVETEITKEEAFGEML